MTYITYNKSQFSVYKKAKDEIYTTEPGNKTYFPERLQRYGQPPKKIPSILPKPKFMPNKLIRTSDMKVARGSQVNEGYCTLSYSWNQSGELVKNEVTGFSERYDRGRHKIVFPPRTMRKKPRGRVQTSRKAMFVKFEGIIQQICKDFNIKYICSAYCTVALVPELEAFRPDSAESKLSRQTGLCLRISMDEAFMDIGRVTIIIKDAFYRSQHSCMVVLLCGLITPTFRPPSKQNVSAVLHYAHTRVSTKEHDRIFALANIFPGIMENFIVDYNQEIQKLMLRFYGVLAERDLSILCFGPRTDYLTICENSSHNSINKDNKGQYKLPIQNFDLSSWTGVYEEHIRQYDLKVPFNSYIINGKTMEVTCTSMANDKYIPSNPILEVKREDIPPIPQTLRVDDNWYLVVPIQLPGGTNDKLVSAYSSPFRAEEKITALFCRDVTKMLRGLSHFVPIKKANSRWISGNECRAPPLFFFDWLLPEELEETTKYALLLGIQFVYNNNTNFILYPVIKKDGGYYKAIGVCGLWRYRDIFTNDYTPADEQTFKIQ